MATAAAIDDTKERLDKKERVLVASIDFGTTYSGYAFSFKHEYDKQPDKVNTYQWSEGLMSLKAPTVVLFDQDGEFDSFGYEAEERYSELSEDNEHEDYYYFKRFKMELYGKKISRDITVKDVLGKEMKALKVFGEAIKFLKDHLFETLKGRGVEVLETDVHWVLTVPAIWSETAKQFMREAAYEAEIDGALLTIALEPEAASLYCQDLPTESVTGLSGTTFTVTKSGTKYMVVDLGGGTADITVHEKQEDGTLKEVHKATGGAWGGTKVDDEFTALLIRIVGAPVYDTFRRKHMEDYINLVNEFETRKRAKLGKKKNITIKVPVKIAELYRDTCGEEIQDGINENDEFKGKILWQNDKLRLDSSIYEGLFKKCKESLITHIKNLLDKPDVKGTNIILMVGGFSESEFMQEAMRTAFPKVRVIVPREAGLAVLKGAVIFGHKPIYLSIRSRVAQYTYGINISPPFDSTIHPPDHLVSVAGVERCRDVFKKYIREGELLQTGDKRSGKHVSLKSGQREMLLKVYASPNPDPMFVDETDAVYIGNLIVNLPESDEKIRVNVNMICGETELTVEAEAGDSKYVAYFDFLNPKCQQLL